MPTFTVRAFFVCHDARLSDQAVLTLDRDTAPTEDEVRSLVFAEAEAVVERRTGDRGLRVDLQDITIEPAAG